MLYYKKKVLNNDGQHFHWYQQNKPSCDLSSQSIEHEKRQWHMTLEIQVLTWNRHTN